MRIAIHQNEEIFHHSTSWNMVWIEYCIKEEIEYEIVDCFDTGIISKLRNFDILLWHLQNYVLQDMLFARSIINAAINIGLKVFPDINTAWHYDDKIAEMLLLESINAPIPKSWIFGSKRNCLEWIKGKAEFPIVAKLICGAGSNNVRLLRNQREAVLYAERMFRKGYKSHPRLLFKFKSNIKSAKDPTTFISRLKRIPEFLRTLSRAKRFGRERDYCNFQEFIPNDGYDIKVAIVGDKASFLIRNVRKGDFRASGGGSIYYDKSLVPEQIIRDAFQVSNMLGFQCMGYDFVVDNRSNKGLIVEISYGFSHSAQLDSGGYWDKHLIWHNVPMNAPEEVLKNLIKQAV